MKGDKEDIRRRIWRLLEERGVARFPKPIYGRIPNFVGAEEAAAKIVGLEEYRDARVVKVSPDSPQRYIRYRCLLDGKILVMPTPRLREGFLVLDPKKIPNKRYAEASTIRGAFTYGEKTPPERLPAIDLIVTGSVAVTENGLRLGKGGGYSELEYAILSEIGKFREHVVIATNVHDLQIVESLPHEPHDLIVDVIATPTRLIRVRGEKQRPYGIIWELLSPEKLDEIPILRYLRDRGPR
ncbi:MAG: 5-formyltetrahydrofolate cyclo-ligase [Nitrososphaeria archaeon]|nr:5-formyltetrahydrofolate cyclo-ligase [Nitrososphaeria archaeon]MDW8021492.1 5-formyltetrahydrofolate cyclo-ligase [Nitrososphaerota archaeon]